MKMSSWRWSVEHGPVAQHRPQDVDPPSGQRDKSLSVLLALSLLAVVELSGGSRATKAGKRRLVERSFEHLVAPAHSAVIAGAFTGVVGGRNQPRVSGELIGTLEGGEISNGDQEFSPEDHTHSRQASDDLSFGSGEKT